MGLDECGRPCTSTVYQAQKNRDDCVRKDMQMGGVTEENGVIRWQVIHSEMVNMHLKYTGIICLIYF